MNILSIDAWGEPDGGWTWNNWFKIGTITKEEFEKLNTNRKILKWFRDQDYLTDLSKGQLAVEDDQYNIVIMRRSNRMPLLAIEYGPEY